VYRLTLDLSRAQRLGSYQLVEPIGSGGMGEVWKARHQLLARPAAIKLIRPERLGGQGASAPRDVLRRFEREANATATLRSPHTIELYDFGVTPDGTFYYVMELLEGLDLKSLVEKFGPIPVSRAAHLLWQVCHSLEDAHHSGLVHRDIKPSNIFTCRRGRDFDFVKVLDFGLVKSVGTGQETLDLSMEGVVHGTPGFMAPEIATGAKNVDARADLYSLGCVGYWLVTGKPVFEAPTPVATILQHVRDRPVPPSERLGTALPAAFERAILDCLQKDPADRPASAARLAARLAEAAGSWTAEDASAWWNQNVPPAPALATLAPGDPLESTPVAADQRPRVTDLGPRS
jgi:serine/threonine-protein kinase